MAGLPVVVLPITKGTADRIRQFLRNTAEQHGEPDDDLETVIRVGLGEWPADQVPEPAEPRTVLQETDGQPTLKRHVATLGASYVVHGRKLTDATGEDRSWRPAGNLPEWQVGTEPPKADKPDPA